ncbi:MAG TPA: sigma-54 dependent transcriptional regulator [Gemmatales bacterium]|nr:sigma-54 dependent transcriptional regulator [Gemmatales bacterium]
MSGRILVVDDERRMCEWIDTELRLRSYEVQWYTAAKEAHRALLHDEVDAVLTDVRMPGTTGIEFCRQISTEQPGLPVIVMTAFGSVESAVAALRAGAYDFVVKPVETDLLVAALERAVQHRRLQRQGRALAETGDHRLYFGDILGESQPMQRVYAQIARLAPTHASILLTGESGTGKELVARSLHRHSRRASAPFVAVNCAAVPEALLESELFGHAKGAFTDARQERQGLFVQAEGGTLMLDEIGELPLAMQVKLLRALEARTVRPVGSDREVQVDARVISATNRDLEAAVQDGRFREDLYYRINVIQLDLPPLRDRGTDILLLAQRFLATFAASTGKTVTSIQPAAAERLLAYPWPGNVRELRNVMERAVALTSDASIAPVDLPDRIGQHRRQRLVLDTEDAESLVPLEQLEKQYILQVLEAVRGNRSRAAVILGLDRKTLYRRLKQYGVET